MTSGRTENYGRDFLKVGGRLPQRILEAFPHRVLEDGLHIDDDGAALLHRPPQTILGLWGCALVHGME